MEGPEFSQMDVEEWPQNLFEMSKDAVTTQKKSACSKVKSAAENHEENQSSFPDTVGANESAIGVPVENKLMKAGKEHSLYLDPSHC